MGQRNSKHVLANNNAAAPAADALPALVRVPARDPLPAEPSKRKRLSWPSSFRRKKRSAEISGRADSAEARAAPSLDTAPSSSSVSFYSESSVETHYTSSTMPTAPPILRAQNRIPRKVARSAGEASRRVFVGDLDQSDDNDNFVRNARPRANAVSRPRDAPPLSFDISPGHLFDPWTISGPSSADINSLLRTLANVLGVSVRDVHSNNRPVEHWPHTISSKTVFYDGPARKRERDVGMPWPETKPLPRAIIKYVRRPSDDNKSLQGLGLQTAAGSSKTPQTIALPEPDPRSLVIEKQLRRAGHDVDLLLAQRLQKELEEEAEKKLNDDKALALQIQQEEEEQRLQASQPKTHSCMVCTDSLPPLDFPARPPTATCSHAVSTCQSCLAQWISSEMDAKGWERIGCPECHARLGYDDIRRGASAEDFEKYDRFAALSMLATDPRFRWCVAPGCSSGQIHEEQGGNFFKCAGCGYEHCVRHGIKWHEGESCFLYDYRTSGLQDRDRHRAADEAASQALMQQITKKCLGVNCGWRIEKNEGCDHMTCEYYGSNSSFTHM